MTFIKNHIVYIILLSLFGFIIYDRRQYLFEKFKEKRILIWILISLSLLVSIVIWNHFSCLSNVPVRTEKNFYEPEYFERMAFYACAFCGICCFILKLICRYRGYPISYFINHQWDIKNSIKIIKYDRNLLIRSLASMMFMGALTSFVVLIIAFSYI